MNGRRNLDIWFTSVESFAKVLSERNREMLPLIAQRRPDSLDALATASGRAKTALLDFRRRAGSVLRRPLDVIDDQHPHGAAR